VKNDIEAEVISGLASRADAMQPMDGLADGAKIGPLSSAQQLQEVDGFVTRAKAEGAKVVAGGRRVDNKQGGYFYAPTIISNVSSEMEVAREEIFGPVLSVISYDTVSEAIRIANDIDFG